ncbi:DUF3618 domain-containing protein [Gymnodinialimonas hymeniacidonis]|uniref:DUF3618 domain-containing protein n=1 Tax=Gymnodinialimonas hymeniacidonis TaxID=3126508 RepID=UPI0034C6783F
MTNETRSPEEIEREIEEQRSDLTSNIEDLQDKFSIDTIVRQIGDQFREHGGDMGRSISEQVKANPVPLALTGIGLAWLMFGSGKGPSVGSSARVEHDGQDNHRLVDYPVQRERPASLATRGSVGYDSIPSWARDDEGDSSSVKERVADAASGAQDQAAKGAAAAKAGVKSSAQSASDTASSVVGKVSDAAASAKASLADSASTARDNLSAAGQRIAEGTEALSEDGRRRVITARQKAMELRRQTARSVQQGSDAAADFYDRQPLVVGALAVAIGAALGGALPRSKVEDDLMGTQSDALFSEAERVFEEEKAKAMAVGQSVKEEAKDIASETKSDLDSGAPGEKSAAQAVSDKAKSAVHRVADAAETAAKDEKLGKPNT